MPEAAAETRKRAPLSVSYQLGPAERELRSPNDLLAVFEFGRSPLASSQPRHVPVALSQLCGPPRIEVWRCEGPTRTGEREGLRFCQGRFLTMGHLVLDLRQHANIREASRLAYRRLQEFLQQSPHPWPLKIWNYIPGINEGSGDKERYRQFCLGRAEAVRIDTGERPFLPAATAIGTSPGEPALQLYFLAGALPGLDVENPRQVNAWRYPRQYGPSSPLFSRGTILRMNDSQLFLISGTASILGHQTLHESRVAEQFRESLRNVRSLLMEGRRLMGDSRVHLHKEGALKVYIRRPKDLDRIRATFESEAPAEIPMIYLRGDICRKDLLTEVDGFVNCGAVATQVSSA